MLARKADIRQVIEDGGLLRFVWGNCHVALIHPSGYEQTVDGRSYQGFTHSWAEKLHKTETGSTEGKDLVIEWRKKA